MFTHASRTYCCLIILALLTGCAAKKQLYTCKPVKVTREDSAERTLWVARCEGNKWVVFHELVEEGEDVHYTPYLEGSNGKLPHGYIKK